MGAQAKFFFSPSDAYDFLSKEIGGLHAPLMVDITWWRKNPEDKFYSKLSITFYQMCGYKVIGLIGNVTIQHEKLDPSWEFNGEQFDHWGFSETPFWPKNGTDKDGRWFRSTRWNR